MRRGITAAGLAVAVLVFVLPAFADTPESGSDPSVTLAVAPNDFVGSGQTVSVTGAGFPANTPGVIRQCGGPRPRFIAKLMWPHRSEPPQRVTSLPPR